MTFSPGILAVALVVMIGGCSKKKSADNTSEIDGDAPPKDSEIQPPEKSEPEPNQQNASGRIMRGNDGRWIETDSGDLFSGRVVHVLDSIRWEEKFQNGVRVFMRAWDEEDNPVELHGWNPDGSPRN